MGLFTTAENSQPPNLFSTIPTQAYKDLLNRISTQKIDTSNSNATSVCGLLATVNNATPNAAIRNTMAPAHTDSLSKAKKSSSSSSAIATRSSNKKNKPSSNSGDTQAPVDASKSNSSGGSTSAKRIGTRRNSIADPVSSSAAASSKANSSDTEVATEERPLSTSHSIRNSSRSKRRRNSVAAANSSKPTTSPRVTRSRSSETEVSRITHKSTLRDTSPLSSRNSKYKESQGNVVLLKNKPLTSTRNCSLSDTEPPSITDASIVAASTRVTRSKDACHEHSFEQLEIKDSVPHAEESTRTKVVENISEQMGLSAVNTARNNKKTKNSSNNNNNVTKSDHTRPTQSPTPATTSTSSTNYTSTDALLFERSSRDFEEAITADYNLRKQLLDASVTKIASDSNKRSELKDILVIKAPSEGDTSASTNLLMESATTAISDTEFADEHTTENQEEIAEQDTEHETEQFLLLSPTTPPSARKDDNSRPQILAVEELPPISTDSTMTASEVGDNIEERLSQLDGGAPITSDVETAIPASFTSTVGQVFGTKEEAYLPTSQQHLQLEEDQQEEEQQLHLEQQQRLVQEAQQHLHLDQQQQVQLEQQQHQLQMEQHNMHSQSHPQHIINPQQESQQHMQEQSISSSQLTTSSTGGQVELDQDIDEMLKVLKGFDGTTTTDLCDLNALFGDVYANVNLEEINSQIAAAAPVVKPDPIEDQLVEIDQSQMNIESKIEATLRRVRKIQAVVMSKHATEEIAGFIEYCARCTNKGGTAESAESITPIVASRPPADYWLSEQQIPVSNTLVSSFLRTIEAAAKAREIFMGPKDNWNAYSTSVPKKIRKSASALAESEENVQETSKEAEREVMPKLDVNAVEELTHVMGLMHSEMHEVQKVIDSDVTDSSSGSESADEMTSYSNPVQEELPIRKRSAYIFSKTRAEVASRWSWTLSQIADMEIKIRQLNELQQEVRRAKGVLTWDAPTTTKNSQATPSSVNGYKGDLLSDYAQREEGLEGSCRTRGLSMVHFRKRKLLQTTNLHTISKKAARPSTIKCGCQWPVLPCALCTGRSDPTAPRDLPDTMPKSERVALVDPGFHSVTSFCGDVNTTVHLEGIARLPDWQNRVSRCLVKSIVKSVTRAEKEANAAANHSSKKLGEAHIKRRYIKRKNNVGSAKATASASVPAAASPNEGATSTASSSAPATPLVANMKNTKRLFTRLPAWNGEMPAAEKMSGPPTSNSSYLHKTSDSPQQKYDQYNLNQAPSSSISSKNSKNRNRSTSNTSTSLHHQSNQQSHYNNMHHYNGDANDNWDCFGTRSRTSSPTQGASSSNYHKYERSLERRHRHSYDIDNIVIPYSVAASTRVEILQYKEIPTPKWRVIALEDSIKTQVKFEENDIPAEVTSAPPALTNGHETVPLEQNEGETEEIPAPTPDLVPCNAEDTGEQAVGPATDETENVPLSTTPCVNENNNISKEITAESFERSGADEEPVRKKLRLDIQDAAKNATSTASFVDLSDNLVQKYATAVASPAKEAADELSQEAEYVEEEISDEAMMLRHERATLEERRKFQTFLKFPYSTRSRANRRIDSRAESSGANTPDPASNPPSVSGGDQESIPSPIAPLTPQTPLDSTNEVVTEVNPGSQIPTIMPISNLLNGGFNNKRNERRRTTSSKKERELQERRSPTPDAKEFIPAFEPLKFPLSDDEFQKLLQEMPAEYQSNGNSNSIDPEDCPTTSRGASASRSRKRSFQNSSASKHAIYKSAIICDSNNKRLRLNDAVTPQSEGLDEGGSEMHLNGNIDDNNEDVDEFEDDGEEDYPKNFLAAGNEDDDDEEGSVDENNEFPPFLVNSMLLSDTQSESSDVEPFEDDDPKDPEWKKSTRERAERSRRKT